MRQYASVVFDATDSVQQPGASNGSSGGQREMAPYLARAAGAAGWIGSLLKLIRNPQKL
jgi:2-dehydro-3-deoxyphosphooctonate aldolase (KDO 8-P synthase)